MTSVVRASNPWVAHVKKYAEEHKIPYTQAVFEAKSSYTKVAKKRTSMPSHVSVSPPKEVGVSSVITVEAKPKKPKGAKAPPSAEVAPVVKPLKKSKKTLPVVVEPKPSLPPQ